jgi:hypothetical protein
MIKGTYLATARALPSDQPRVADGNDHRTVGLVRKSNKYSARTVNV